MTLVFAPALQPGQFSSFSVRRLWRRHHISLRYPPLVSLDTPPGVVSNEFGYDPVPILSDEFKRQGVPNRFWRLSSVNRDYHVCDSYPPVIGVPHGVTDADVTAAAAFRSKSASDFPWNQRGCPVVLPLGGVRSDASAYLDSSPESSQHHTM